MLLIRTTMKIKNEPEVKKPKAFRVIGGITVVYENKDYTQFQVGTKVYKVKGGDILKAFKLAEGEVRRQRKLLAASTTKRDSSTKEKALLPDDRKSGGKALQSGGSLEVPGRKKSTKRVHLQRKLK